MKQEALKAFMDSLTWQEKIGQLVQLSGEFFGDGELATGPKEKLGITSEAVLHAGSVLNVVGAEKVLDIQKRHMEHSRIPLLFMADIVYGYKTVYPIPLALASSWEPKLSETCSRRTALEAAPAGVQVTFSPMVDVVRDARWGRCMESPGEDPLLNSMFAEAMVKGFQGDGTPGESMVSCVKHFAAYGAAEAGREYNTVDMSRWRLLQDYLPPYRAAVNAGCGMVMTSFNTIEGVPATANRWLMDDILRKEWGFEGILITDYAAIAELVAHGVAEDEKQAAYLAMEAGVDIDMKTACYANQLLPLMEDGALSHDKIDAAVWRVLTLKNQLGLFENPYVGIDAQREQKQTKKRENRELARQAARKSMVLLKNAGQTLPLSGSEKIALLGPYADSRDLNGLWAIHGDRTQVATLKTACQEALEGQQFQWTTGCELLDDYENLGDFGGLLKAGTILENSREEELARSIALAKWADVVIFAVGEHMLQSGESGSRTDLTLPEIQRKWMEQVLPFAKKSVVLLFNGRPLVLTDLVKQVDAVLECWFPGTEGARAVVDLLLGKANPEARLTVSFPYAVGQIPIYYSTFSTGRPADKSSHSGRFVSRYLDCPNEPLYPFGYGLSYHTAAYGEIRLSSDIWREGEPFAAEITLENTSMVAGDEVVQLYLHDVAASVVRPIKELKAFQKIHLEPGACKKVSFALDEHMLEFIGQDLKSTKEPGVFEVWIGPNAAEGSMGRFYYQMEQKSKRIRTETGVQTH